MKFRKYSERITDGNGFLATPVMKWFLEKNPRKTSREEAIAAKVIEHANPRQNISGHYPWGPEEQLVLKQLWIHEDGREEWRPIPLHKAEELFDYVDGLPIPKAVKEPGTVIGDFGARLDELLGGEPENE